jgi:GST-like protein
MIEVFFAPTPNGWKITILLEELGVPYRITNVDLGAGEQFEPEFLKVSPNNRIPAITDHAPAAGPPQTIFESGAILLYLAEKHGRFLPKDAAGRYATIQWLMWQMSGLGPMLGQHGHFSLYAQQQVPYAKDRFRNEAARLYGVLDRRLGETGRFLAGDEYTIADMACFPWVMTHKAQKFDLGDFPNAKRWFAELRARDPLQRGLAVGRGKPALSQTSPEMRDRIFGLSPASDTATSASAPGEGRG